MFNLIRKMTMVFSSSCEHDFVEISRTEKINKWSKPVAIVSLKCTKCNFITSQVEKN